MKMHIKISRVDEIRKELDGLDKMAAQIEKYTLSKVMRDAPGYVSKATAEIYAIKKNEVTRAYSKKAGQQHVRTSFKGYNLDSFTMVFQGRKTATWNTKAKPKPKPPKTGNPKIFSTKKKYTVTTEVFKGKRTPIVPQGNNRVFVANIGGKLRPLVVGDSNLPRVHASTSVPQAIMNERVVSIWRPKVETLVVSEFDRIAKLYWQGQFPFPRWASSSIIVTKL